MLSSIEAVNTHCYHMEDSHLKRIFIFLLLSVPLSIVFAQEKILLFGVPWYVPEIFTLGAFGVLVFFERGSFDIYRRRNIFFWALSLMTLGFLVSIFSNDISLHGYGRLKSWFLFPLAYGMMLSFSLRKKLLSLEDVLRAVFLGGVLIGISTLMSIASGGAFSYDHRLHGFFSSPNHLAMLLGTAVLMGIFQCVSLRVKQGKGRAAICSGVLFLLALLLLTQSYMVIFSLMTAVGIWTAKYRKYLSQRQILRFFFGLMLFLGILLSLSGDKWQGIIMQEDRSSLSSREMIWTAALKMIRDHPFIGIGP